MSILDIVTAAVGCACMLEGLAFKVQAELTHSISGRHMDALAYVRIAKECEASHVLQQALHVAVQLQCFTEQRVPVLPFC